MRLPVAPGSRTAVEAALGTLAGTCLLTALVTAVSAADRGFEAALRPGEVLRLAGPLSCAVAVALAVARSRLGGRWDAWEGMGVGRARQLLPLLSVALLGAALQAAAPASEPPSAALAPVLTPAPVAADARLWPGPVAGSWGEPDLARWKVPPSALSGVELRARAREGAPLGARAGVDRAELLRRRGLVLAWPVALLVGAGVALVRTRSRRRAVGSPLAGIAALAGVSATTWLLAVLVLASWVSAP